MKKRLNLPTRKQNVLDRGIKLSRQLKSEGKRALHRCIAPYNQYANGKKNEKKLVESSYPNKLVRGTLATKHNFEEGL